MAKQEKKAAEAAAQVATATVENIREQLDSASMGRAELAQAIKDKLKEEHDEKIKREMMSRYERANFAIDEGLLKLRRERDIAKATKEELAHRDRLARYLMGYTLTEEKFKHIASTPDTVFEKEVADEKEETVTVNIAGKKETFKIGDEVPPIIDYVDYDSLYGKIAENTRKAMNKIDGTHKQYALKLKAKYDEYWNHSWCY